MNKVRSLSFILAAFTLLGVPSMLHAQDASTDDTLRPLVVRPTDAPPADLSSSTTPLPPPPGLNTAVPVPPTPAAVADIPSDARLRLPPPPAPSQVDMTPSAARAAVSAPSARDMFGNFGPPSGSVISDRVLQLRDEAIALRQSVDRDSDEFTQLRGRGAAGAIQYHSTVAAITARLEAGTTRGNPILLRQWSEAEQSLSEVSYSVSKLNMLSSSLAADSSTAAYILQAVRAAFELSGALDEDHDQLSMIRDEVAKSTVNIDRVRTNVAEDIRRQNSYLSTERANLQVLALSINRGELIRNSLAGQPVIVGSDPLYGSLPNTDLDNSGYPSIRSEPAAAPPSNIMPPPNPAPALPVQKSPLTKSRASHTAEAPQPSINDEANSLGQLLVLVRFNDPDVEYEQQLYQAVSSALDRKPDASFTIVAVSPKGNDPASYGSDVEKAQRKAEAVKSSLVQLGLQPGRISMSNISSEAAEVPEVHIYIR
jgi:hypothetical protein